MVILGRPCRGGEFSQTPSLTDPTQFAGLGRRIPAYRTKRAKNSSFTNKIATTHRDPVRNCRTMRTHWPIRRGRGVVMRRFDRRNADFPLMHYTLYSLS